MKIKGNNVIIIDYHNVSLVVCLLSCLLNKVNEKLKSKMESIEFPISFTTIVLITNNVQNKVNIYWGAFLHLAFERFELTNIYVIRGRPHFCVIV